MKWAELIVAGVSCPRPRATSRRARTVARWFQLDQTKSPPGAIQPRIIGEIDALVPDAGRVVLISGPSGSGKTVLLGAIGRIARARHMIDLNSITLPDRPLVDCFGGLNLHRCLRLLGRVGLAEAWTYLRTPAQLSEGQRWRMRLAIALHRARSRGSIVVCDEFAAVLDRISAAVAARALRRVASKTGVGAIVATSHDDLLQALDPDIHVRCDFERMRIEHLTPGTSARARSDRGSRKRPG